MNRKPGTVNCQKPLLRTPTAFWKEMLVRPHEKLDVWNRAVDLVVAVYRVTDPFPREEKFGLTSQIRRAAVSVPANIAEGAARTYTKEFL